MFPPPAHPHLAGWCHIMFFGIFIPLTIVRRRKLVLPPNAPLPDRTRHFFATGISLTVLSGLSLGVAYAEGIRLFSSSWPSLPAVLAGIAFYAVAVVLMRPRWRRAVEKRTRIVYLFMPQKASERIGWIAVSVLAGVGEEITWRGVQFAMIGGFTGDPWTAAILTSISFGVAHVAQGWSSAVVIGGFALAFHGLVWLSGSLYVAMAVHAAYDLTAGFTYGKLGRELGYAVEPPPDRPQPSTA